MVVEAPRPEKYEVKAGGDIDRPDPASLVDDDNQKDQSSGDPSIQPGEGTESAKRPATSEIQGKIRRAYQRSTNLPERLRSRKI